jgi:hypothetical protein
VAKEWTLAWGDNHQPVAVTDADHLVSLLRDAAKEAATTRTMVELVAPSGASCAIGLGGASSVATFMANASEPPWFISRGAGSSDAPLVFFYDGHLTEFGPEAAIPIGDALAAVRAFYETGARPNIDWDEA